jgi:hypothetical protein
MFSALDCKSVVLLLNSEAMFGQQEIQCAPHHVQLTSECRWRDLGKRRRSDNRSCAMGNMVKTMSVIHTHRKTSKQKDASESRRPTKSSRLTMHNTSGFLNAASPRLESSTAYDPSTSPTYYHTSSSVETGSRAKVTLYLRVARLSLTEYDPFSVEATELQPSSCLAREYV